MSSHSQVATPAQEESVLRGVLTLLRPRIAVMVFIVTLLGAVLAAPGSLLRSLEAALWVTLVTGSASILNQVFERDTDRLMERTKHRPLVRGTIAVHHALFFAVALGVIGVTALTLSFNLLAGLLSLATLVAYVCIYTPMKRVSTLNTVIGAIPGAAPPLLGWVAMTGQVAPLAWMMFGILFVWQFPHFLAIAWIYREDYARADMKMLPSVPGSAGIAGRSALIYAAVLLPISLMPAVRGDAGPIYAIGALVLGLAYLFASAAFALRENHKRARAVLLVSLAYLPLVFTLILIDPAV